MMNGIHIRPAAEDISLIAACTEAFEFPSWNLLPEDLLPEMVLEPVLSRIVSPASVDSGFKVERTIPEDHWTEVIGDDPICLFPHPHGGVFRMGRGSGLKLFEHPVVTGGLLRVPAWTVLFAAFLIKGAKFLSEIRVVHVFDSSFEFLVLCDNLTEDGVNEM